MSLLTGRGSGNGARAPSAPRLSVEPPATGRRRRTPELVVGILLVVGWSLGTVLLVTSGRDRIPVLALATDVARGQVITGTDLSTVYVGSDGSIAHLGEGEAGQVVGRAALADLAAGTVVTREQFARTVGVLEPGAATVGLSLEAGQLPSLRLAPGDRVSVVTGGSVTGEAEAGQVVEAGDVVSVEVISDGPQDSTQRRWWVAIRASDDEARRLAEVVAAEARVQLVLVGA